ncbi:hypothetical protein ACA30_02330 [Virgibacillus soli]|uniref:Uncharacterized protein n=2 Tax=Lederbergia galactosidilytica TaxID=217031 RepID=A0A0Q9XWZ9_9BACI|nr:hypothetical protein ACA29_09270 [Lederbergia galactosidilytica]KRG16135.1 hypothetical protein ACA30_02330 [Virgibacillus soli]OAK74011.1 hypothetical protein ABB05_06250 [Lederbergia galactosidilytica]
MEDSALKEILHALELQTVYFDQKVEQLEEQFKGIEQRIDLLEKKIDSSISILPKQRKMLIYF